MTANADAKRRLKQYDLDHANLNGRLDPRPTGHRYRTLGPGGETTFHRTREACNDKASELCDELRATVLVEEYARGNSGYWLWGCIGGFDWHTITPDDLPEPGDRCKTCGREVVWIGPSTITDWVHT